MLSRNTRARFRLAHLLIPLAFASLALGLYALTGTRSADQRSYLIDRAAWGSRQNSGAGRWLVLGPKGEPTAQIGFDALWTRIRVEDHQAYKRPVAPAGRVQECKTTFQTDRLNVTAYSCRGRGVIHVAIRNDLDQPRVVLVEGN
jgi:hypothetical protein